MPRRKRRSQLNEITEINMTPLIDLTFLLLIVFMITMPLMEYSTDVSPPEMNATPMPNEETFTVEIRNNGKTYFNGKEESEEELKNSIKGVLENKAKASLFLRADGTIEYNKVIDVMKVMKSAGANNISLITQEEG